jgi:hypothetical protein
MDDSLRAFKTLSRHIHRRLVPHEDIIYRVEDVLLFQYPARAALLFLVVNLAYGAIVWCVRPSVTTAILALAALLAFVRRFWAGRPRARYVTRLLRPFVASSVKRLEGGQRRFGIADVAAFAVTGVWAAAQIWRDAAAAAKQRDLEGISRFALGFLAGFFALAALGDAAVLWLVVNGALLLPWVCSRLSGATP